MGHFKKQKMIRFSGYGTVHQNGASERAIKMLGTIESTMLMHAALRCPKDKFSTDILAMPMDYAVWVYNCIREMKSGLSAIEIWSRSRFEPMSKTLSNCHVWGRPTYVLEPKFQKPVVKIPKWDTII